MRVLSRFMRVYNGFIMGSILRAISNWSAHFKTIIKTKFSRINVLASFSNISLEIKEGHINLNQKNIKGEIKSISADVSCVSREVKLLVRSKNGLVSGLYNSYIEPDLKVETIRGNITTECLIN